MVLRHAGIGLYYAGRKHWVGDPGAAKDLETIERAAELSREKSFEQMEIVATYGEPASELVLPIRRKKSASDKNRAYGGLNLQVRQSGPEIRFPANPCGGNRLATGAA